MSEKEIIGEGVEKADQPVPQPPPDAAKQTPPEFGGREGLEPTRYGDWEKNGRCIDF
ncbi:DUF1674 domain-containing protein [Lysobacter sp. HDW10]|uniref:DUF1674 domain-containing protein n=1 Tax=Lysobacter sp. HDW10 TaxID=2714936 RepID=UPI00140C4A40|nr:DUF1674 domain-containing protein [Lysobacter sp. HDW10]QIK81887.1 DUF1674 domain-containing protein [Lysobacter sp. HDW10]